MTNERSERAGRVDDAEIQAAVPRQAGGREVRVGVFVLLGIAATLAVLFAMTDPATFRGRYMLVTGTPDAGGLRQGDPVQMRGVNIGRVRGFEMVGNAVSIILEIEGAWEVPDDSHTQLGGEGLLGGRTLEVIPGASPTALSPWDTLPGAEGEVGLMTTAEEVGDRLNRVLERGITLLEEPTVTSARNAIAEFSSLAAELRGLVREQRGAMGSAIENVNSAAQNVADGTEEVVPAVIGAVERVDSTLVRLDAAATTFESAAARLEAVLAAVEAGEGTLGRLAADDSLYVQIAAMVESITLLATDVRENPGRYFRLRLF